MTETPNIVFQRQAEPTEGAFSLLVPQGWQMRGGIVRSNLMQQRVTAQNIEAKVDFGVLREPEGHVMIRWCPEFKYCDARFSPAGQMGFFQQGSNYMGMLVWPVMPAAQFLVQMMFPWAHPQNQNARLLEQKPVPEQIQKYQQMAQRNGVSFQYDAATVVYTYTEGGVAYKEVASTVIEAMGQLGAGAWSNKECVYMRAPEAEFETWFPVLMTILRSGHMNPQWRQMESQSEGVLTGAFRQAQAAEQYRARKALETQQYIQGVQREIAEHHSQTQAEIRNDQWLTLTGQEEYVNPITNEVDLGSNEWNFRWVSPNGDVFYANHEGDDPNQLNGGVLNRTDWQRTPVRPRFPQ